MTQLRWIYTQPDGSVAVLSSAHLEQLAKEGWDTPDKVRALVLGKAIAQGATDIVEMPAGWEPPEDRTFRNAWRRKGQGAAFTDEFDVDMPAAREIHRDKIRRHRIAALASLDIEYQRADEDNDQSAKQRVIAEKRRLRDLPADPRIDAAETPEELVAVVI